MKKLKLYILGIFLSPFFTNAQQVKEYNDGVVKITYTQNRPPYTSASFETYLYTNETRSQYHHHQKAGTHSEDGNYSIDLPYFQYINDYDFQNNKVEDNRILKNNNILYAQWENNLVWEITNEEKMIGEYKVKKATTDSFEIEKDNKWYYGKAIAWFTTDIPIPTGPARYYGLPGLILELEYENEKELNYKFKSLEHLSPSEFQFTELNKDNEVEKEDVIYFFHKNPKKIKEIQRNNRKK